MALNEFEVQQEYRGRLNNEIVVPSYRRFCKEHGLGFHFWDELPEGEFDPEISEKERKPHEEAMNLFNALKPEFIIFGNSIVWFRFTDWGGDFTYRAWSIQEFLDEAAARIAKAKVWERQAQNAVGIISAIVVLLFVFWFLCLLRGRFGFISCVIGTILGCFVALRIQNFLIDRHLEKIETDKQKYVTRLEHLKKRFSAPTG